MVEAAVVFPVVILAVMAVIGILTFLFQQVELQSKMHIALREESGRQSQTVVYLTRTEAAYPIVKKGKQVNCQKRLVFAQRGILAESGKDFSAHSYIDDEKKIVRYFDLVK